MNPMKVNSMVSPAIQLQGMNADDLIKTENALQKIKNTPTGNALLNEIRENTTNGREVQIHVHDSFTNSTIPMLTDSQLRRLNIDGNNYGQNVMTALSLSRKRTNSQNGEGVKGIVDFNPKQAVHVDSNGVSQRIHDEELSYMSLGHELIHALHFMRGNHIGDSRPDVNGNINYQEELRVVGLGQYANNDITENKMRRESGLPQRLQY